jgi:hypothetical protein
MSTQQTTRSNRLPHHWPNLQTCNASLTIGINIACYISKVPHFDMLKINTPFRIVSGLYALHNKKKYKVVMDILGLVALFFPYGQIVSVGVDSLSEIVNFYDRPPIKAANQALVRYEQTQNYRGFLEVLGGVWVGLQKIFSRPPSSRKPIFRVQGRIDPTVYANACIILGLNETEAKDLEAIKKIYEKTVESLRKIMQKLPPIVADDVQASIDETQIAYETVTKPLISDISKILGNERDKSERQVNQ